jgi:cytoskeletal protein CcmA (bactofilin family)
MFRLLSGFLVITLAAVMPATAQSPGPGVGGAHTFAEDQFAAGGTVRVQRAVIGDLLAVGGNVDVGAAVGGDAVVAGGNLRLGSAVGGSLYAAGGQLIIAGEVGQSARVAGGEVALARGAQIGGNLSAAGGRVDLNGTVKGYVQAAGGEVYINGPVGGDVTATSGRIELGPQARIAGRLRYASRSEPVVDPAAQIAGGIERMPVRMQTVRAETVQRAGRAFGWIWTAGLMVLAAVLVAALPGFYLRVADTAQRRLGFSALMGFIVLVCVPVAAVLAMVTVIGLPLGLLLLLLYLPLLLMGYVSAAIALGDGVLARWQAAAPTGWRIVAAMLAVLVIGLAARLPWIGGLFVLAALLIGVGALALQWRRRAPALPA